MTKFGQVYEYNEKTRIADIHFSRPEACTKCGACGSLSQTGTIALQADCKVGDWVRVEMPEGRFLEATAIAYVIPLAGLFLGIASGWFVGKGNDGLALAGAMIGLLVSVGVLWFVNRRISGRPEWTPRVTEVFTDKPNTQEIGCDRL